MKPTVLDCVLQPVFVSVLALHVGSCAGQEPQLPRIVLQRTIERAHYRTVHSLAWAPDSGSLVSGSSDFRAILWTTPELEAVHWSPNHRGSVYSVAFSPSGSLFASADHHGLVRVYDAESGELRHEFDSGREAVYAMTFLGDDDRLLLGRGDGEIQIWSPTETRLLERIECTGVIGAVAYSTSERLVAASTFSRAARGIAETASVLMWRCSDDTLSALPRLNGDTTVVSALEFSRSGKLIAVGGFGRRIQVWETGSRDRVCELEGHRVSTTSVSFSPDERYLISTGQDAVVRVWLVSSGDLISEFEPFRNGTGQCVRFSPDGKYVAASGGYEPGEIILWSVINGASDDTNARQ